MSACSLFEFIAYLTGLNSNPFGSSDPWVAARPSGSLAGIREVGSLQWYQSSGVVSFLAGSECELQESVAAVAGCACFESGCWFARAAVGFILGLCVRVGMSRRLREPACVVAFTGAGLWSMEPVEGVLALLAVPLLWGRWYDCVLHLERVSFSMICVFVAGGFVASVAYSTLFGLRLLACSFWQVSCGESSLLAVLFRPLMQLCCILPSFGACGSTLYLCSSGLFSYHLEPLAAFVPRVAPGACVGTVGCASVLIVSVVHRFASLLGVRAIELSASGTLCAGCALWLYHYRCGVAALPCLGSRIGVVSIPVWFADILGCLALPTSDVFFGFACVRVPVEQVF
ncbi:hypothetical protein Taro_055461 [Colocasia esculenta]|uniref:Transmembrane protein n=1 Tax=Colocasia esculenta TaxID=4460 RepID=A0A843XRG0_COLES|nr:hypothetical protein [Colocasia esculenta]